MSKQIAVRLPDDMVANIDALIADGATSSRASFVESALEREFRRRLAERDVEILMALKASGEKDDFDDLAEWGAHQPLGID